MSEKEKQVTAFIAVGANLGPRYETIAAAVGKIGQLDGVRIVKESTLIETAPVGGPEGQGMFVNGAIKIETLLGAEVLLQAILTIEDQLGRVRNQKWGPRLIDLDLIFYGRSVIDEPHLQVPHPLMHTRGFVLVPMVELAPKLRHPLLGETMQLLLDEHEACE